MLIRHADPASDGPACAAVYAPFVTDSVISFEYEAPSGAEMAERIGRLAATHAFLVAEDSVGAGAGVRLGADTGGGADTPGGAVAHAGPGEVVGFAYGSPHRDRAAYRWAAEVSVYVSASRHRQGVARALYGALFELLERQGFRMLLAVIALPNEASVSLHEALGFELLGVYRQIGWKNGSWHDVACWQRQLGAAGAPPGDPPGPPVRLSERV